MEAGDDATPAALFVNGTVGSGKTTTASEIGIILQQRGGDRAGGRHRDRRGTARLHSRIISRHQAGAERNWHLARAGELAAILAAAQVGDVTVDVDDHPPGAVAAQVVRAVGWTDSFGP